jgi:hypothetical protein
MALNVLIFLAGRTAEAIALETGSGIALAAQQIFGIATALIGVGVCADAAWLASVQGRQGAAPVGLDRD